ncbi:MAG: 30S ribosomal protein S16 [Chloroflexota bacterium]|nr:30S ribosomal protein S16 [Chloroflexota bacterium]MDE2901159.1 30S ribosomal protein S16 [Chloroflexota bacterium]MDE2969937.1 30S ribosomal protein S16 [Chloroflexota bacterium]
MLRIRLRRMGKKKQPSYRVVVMDSRAPRDGGYIDQVGLYNPRSEPKTVEIDTDKALKWMQNGAQPSQPVERLLRNLGVLEKA